MKLNSMNSSIRPRYVCIMINQKLNQELNHQFSKNLKLKLKIKTYDF